MEVKVWKRSIEVNNFERVCLYVMPVKIDKTFLSLCTYEL